MADPKGFLTTPRQTPKSRPVDVRIKDWREVYEEFENSKLTKQAGRCMDCGIPFCHQGCPLGNLIPEWNTLTWRDDWREAIERLHATNNFPEFTGTLCPAPCETACVLGINDDPVTIKRVEISIIDRAWEEGWVTPQPPATRTGKKVAVVGSGPAGDARVAYVPTTDWTGPDDFTEGLHPNAPGHRALATHLTAWIAARAGLRPRTPVVP